ncbi:MAG TPA: YopX family protein [Anaeromyxobacteraceae bacterium]|nr:YopX family protein [Anaeromyxobacteraceae bacterium]
MPYDFQPRPIRYRVWDGERMWRAASDDSAANIFEVASLLRRPSECVILQSTGLADADGREVFDGDIIEWGGRRLPVEYAEGAWWACDDPLRDILFGEHPPVARVIGNVFENADLLPAA